MIAILSTGRNEALEDIKTLYYKKQENEECFIQNVLSVGEYPTDKIILDISDISENLVLEGIRKLKIISKAELIIFNPEMEKNNPELLSKLIDFGIYKFIVHENENVDEFIDEIIDKTESQNSYADVAQWHMNKTEISTTQKEKVVEKIVEVYNDINIVNVINFEMKAIADFQILLIAYYCNKKIAIIDELNIFRYLIDDSKYEIKIDNGSYFDVDNKIQIYWGKPIVEYAQFELVFTIKTNKYNIANKNILVINQDVNLLNEIESNSHDLIICIDWEEESIIGKKEIIKILEEVTPIMTIETDNILKWDSYYRKRIIESINSENYELIVNEIDERNLKIRENPMKKILDLGGALFEKIQNKK